MNNRTRNWTFILYPESCGELSSFLPKLSHLKVPCLLSPLHSPDDEMKKPHYHVGLFFSSVKSYNQVLSLIQSEFGQLVFGCDTKQVVSTVFPIIDKTQFIRYLIHYGFTEKEQFTDLLPLEYIEKINYPYDIGHYFNDLNDVDCTLFSIISYIRTSCIFSYADLCNSYLDSNDYVSFNCCKKNRSFLIDYMRSIEYKNLNFEKRLNYVKNKD